MKLQAPLASAVAVPIWVAPSKITTVLFAGGRAGQGQGVSLVVPSPATPLSVEVGHDCGCIRGNGVDRDVSTVEAALKLPAASVALR